MNGVVSDTFLPSFLFSRFPFQKLTVQINLPVCMLPQRKQEKNWPTLITTSMGFPSQDFVFLPYMVLGVAQIWLTFPSRGTF